ncbi:hypothetical protein niasHT_015106 [Heterodera trifolii]|uniref:Uncharacterized protein n=1 Tax=Heterodera trifolii TaxID=157864 RepID=A0ABD2L9J7_9BILA
MEQEAIHSDVAKDVQETVSFLVDNVVDNVFKEYKRLEEEIRFEERQKRNISLSELKNYSEIFNHQTKPKKPKLHDDVDDSIIFVKEVPAFDKHIGLDDSFNRGDDTKLIAALEMDEEEMGDNQISMTSTPKRRKILFSISIGDDDNDDIIFMDQSSSSSLFFCKLSPIKKTPLPPLPAPSLFGLATKKSVEDQKRPTLPPPDPFLFNLATKEESVEDEVKIVVRELINKVMDNKLREFQKQMAADDRNEKSLKNEDLRWWSTCAKNCDVIGRKSSSPTNNLNDDDDYNSFDDDVVFVGKIDKNEAVWRETVRLQDSFDTGDDSNLLAALQRDEAASNVISSGVNENEIIDILE